MAADELKRRGEDPQPNEDDVEGHSMLPNMGISRSLAQSRERDIQQHLKRHDLEAEARAHKKGH
ncbi:MAG: hypothetical protein ACYDCI_05000 [Candidatus Limnocylindrales bacterium]